MLTVNSRRRWYIFLFLFLLCCRGILDKCNGLSGGSSGGGGILLKVDAFSSPAQFRYPRPLASVSLFQTSNNRTVARWPDFYFRRRRRNPIQDDDEKEENKKATQHQHNRSIFGWVIPFWNFVRVRSVLIAIQVVLRLELERPVLSRLPPNVLMFLVRTCIQAKARPKVIRIVALELDERLRHELKKITGKDDYEFGDLTKAALRSYTGKKTYEFGDLTKTAVRKYTGKEEYEFGDLTQATVRKYTGKKDYEFGDLTRTTIRKLMEAQENYEFGDITRAIIGKLKGEEEEEKVAPYQFGDISRSILTKISGREKYQFGDITRRLLRQAQAAEEGSKKISSKYLDDVQQEIKVLEEMS